jgi:hypothetical protein
MAPVLPIVSLLRNNRRLAFFGGWLLLNLLQAGMTGLFDDEAYYWAYSNYPAWGYFDHPPMIAMFIKAGYLIFKNELGVRLLVVLAATAVLLTIETILRKKDDPLFYAIACSMAVLQIGSFMALPDIPLMLFTALFFLIYRQYLERADFLNTVLMGLVIALMLYSKYQSVLIIFFTLISNPGLLLKKQTWVVGAIALACMLPHLNWQLQHGFISLQYQLERNSGNSYQLGYTLEYLLGQILFAGPFAGVLLLWAAFAYRPGDLFEKSLKYTLLGTYCFFLLMTMKGRVEANWTLPAFVPLIILSYKYLQSKPVITRWLFRLAPVTLVCVLILRVYLALDVSPASWIEKDEVHGNHQWIQAIQEKAKGLPVVFLDSYQKASRYWFYTGQPSFSLNTPKYRRNNYNLWPVEDSFLNKPVYVVGAYDKIFLKDSIVTPKGLQGGMTIPHYISFSKTNIRPEKRVSVINGTAHRIKLSIVANQLPVNSSGLNFLNRAELQLWIDRNKLPSKIINTGIPLNQLLSGEDHFITSFQVDLPDGKYQARFAIPSAVPEMPTVNSAFIQLRLSKK